MDYRASISIFRNEPNFEYEKVSKPLVPDCVFQLALKIAAAKKGCEFIKTPNGVYIVRYSEFGPYNSKITNTEEWLPVYVARVEKWSSGGIKAEEMEAFKNSTPLGENPENPKNTD